VAVLPRVATIFEGGNRSGGRQGENRGLLIWQSPWIRGALRRVVSPAQRAHKIGR